ncbi:hypothetical protein MJ1_0680 [Nanobdella aerobiophila]|uniref:Uncharacterized protein n=1 Tax=Nanobdella aerobiophila TaxID=2586965 RepID=A0A915SD04_9ARCH|nr:hypothetical protein [Nanobdella aerobiophila]BBL45823.1 hypothetical protein MJ1_0680 [Nanobdella aerobiophila]
MPDNNINLDTLRNEKIEDNKHKYMEIKIIFDSQNIKFEQIYYWLLDFIRDNLKMNISKLSDDFTSSVGSAFFGEMSSRASAVLATARSAAELINNLTKSIISILDEYKQIQSKIILYEKVLSNDKDEAYSAYITLKDIWLNNVDSTRGGASLFSIARGSRNSLGYSTAPDLFYLTEIKSEVQKLLDKNLIGKALFDKLFNEPSNIPRDIGEVKNKKIVNEKVSNIVDIRLQEYYNWFESNRKFLYDRYNLLKSYLKHQLSSLLYYTEYAKPYFKFARKLLQNPNQPVDIINALETAIIDLSLLSVGKENSINTYNAEKDTVEQKLYIPVYDIQIRSRAFPTIINRIERSGMYTFIGRTDINFRVYLLEKSEYENLIINQEEEDLLYITGLTDDYIKDISDLILESFLYDIIRNDNNLLKITAEKSKVTEADIKNNPYKIRWSKELLEELEKDQKIKKALGSIMWIKKYLPENKEEKKEENKEKKKSESSIKYIFPSLNEIFVRILEFITTYKKDLISISKDIKKKQFQKERDDAMNDLKDKTIDTGWKIYTSFKKTFGMLTY